MGLLSRTCGWPQLPPPSNRRAIRGYRSRRPEATLDHLDLLVPLFDAYRQIYDRNCDEEGARQLLAERLKREESAIFLALHNDDGCGFTQLYPAFFSIAMRPIWTLNDLYVAPQARRRSVGKRLLNAVVAFAAARLVLATAANNAPAQALYAKHGWVKDDAFIHYKFGLD